MTTAASVDTRQIERPKVWKYVLVAVIAYLLLLVLWMLFDFWVLHPTLENAEMETTMDRIRWFGVPLLVLTVLFVGKRILSGSEQEKTLRPGGQKASALMLEKERREYTLEVLGLGITFEKYRQGKLWDTLQHGAAFASIRETDPKKFPWSGFDKIGQSGGRACDALENGVKPSPMYWGVPSFYAGSPILDPAKQPSEIQPMAGLAASAEGTGMAWHLFVTAPWKLSERPDELLEQVFAFFDAHPDLPYAVLLADDSSATRNGDLPPGEPRLIKDGYYIPEMPDSTAVFVLARRERVEPLRPFVWDDPGNDYLQENLRRMYFQLQDTVPNPEKLAHPEKLNIGRLPTVAEWLQAAAAFAKHPYFKPSESEDSPGRWRNDPPKEWKPSPWFPVPWNREQMKAFDSLPSLGYIHRPVFVKFEDEHGQPVKRRDARQHVLEAGWQQALQTLPDNERGTAPARIIAAFGDHAEQLVALEGVLHQYASHGGPEIDSSRSAEFINTDRRLGNTGAATFFMQMALGIMGSYIDGGTSAAVNMRDPDGASIVFISPPTAERRKAQEGRNVFKHQVLPAIDPNNYKPPTVDEALSAHR